MKKILMVVLCLLFLPLTVFADNDVSQIKSTLHQFTTDWNDGNLKKAMTIYDNSTKTKLISDSTMIQGYPKITDYFKKNFPSQKEMGSMTFSDIQVKLLSTDHALAIGKWALQTLSGTTTHGIFSVVYKKTDKGWKIILDHTSGL